VSSTIALPFLWQLMAIFIEFFQNVADANFLFFVYFQPHPTMLFWSRISSILAAIVARILLLERRL
jgi:hypothetical protein